VDQRALIRSLHYAMERKRLLLMREHFLNVVSHELRNPLTSLKGSISLLHEGKLTDEADRREALRIAMDAIERLTRTTDLLLDLAKMNSRKVSMRPARFDLRPLITELGSFFRPDLERKGLAFRTVLPTWEVAVTADRDQIARVLTNLIHNAIKFTPSGSIEVRVSEDQGLALCSVTDTGPGVPAEERPRLFQKFSRLGGAQDVPGTGLGLSICREIVEVHKGRIWVEQAPSQGARFVFALPKAAAGASL